MLEALRRLLARQGFEVTGEASEGVMAVTMCQSLHPDIAVIDRNLPVLSAECAAAEIRKHTPQTRIVILTADNDRAYAQRMVQHIGVDGCVTRSKSGFELAYAIREMLAGNTYMTSGLQVPPNEPPAAVFHSRLRAS